jgi:hypothetical protein
MSELWQRILTYTETDSVYYLSAVKHELTWVSIEERQLLADILNWYVDNHDTVTNEHFNVILDYINNIQ